MATVVATITNVMDGDAVWNNILHNFLMLAISVNKFNDNNSTGRYPIASNPTHIKDMINQQKKIIDTTLDQTNVVTSMPLIIIAIWHLTAGIFLLCKMRGRNMSNHN